MPELSQNLTGSRSARPVRSLLPDLLLLAGLMALAAAVRLPYLHLIPVISDEAFEVLAAQGMVGGQFIWFGPFDPTTGPLVTWLLALAVWLFGSSAYLARVVTLLLGVLTVGLTYLLGRSLALGRLNSLAAGRLAGLAAGLLLAFNPVHTIVNSHVAWSNSATPLFATAALVALHAALRRNSGWLLVLGGLLYGLALQTHISMLVAAPGLLIWFLARRGLRTWLRRPWPYLALLAAALGYGNMIAYNVISQGGLLADARLHTYAWEPNPSLISYLDRLASLLANLGQTAGGQVPRLAGPPAVWVVGLLVAWLVAALVYTAWRGEALPFLVLLSTALVMPYLNKRYDGLLSQRYTAFLLPLCFAAMGVLAARVAGLGRRAGRSAGNTVSQPDGAAGPARRRAALVAVALGLMLLAAAYPLRNTLAYYSAETQAGRDNRLTLAFTAGLKASLPPGAALYISSGLRDKEEGPGYRFLRAVYYYLTMERVEHRILDLPDIAAALQAAPDRDAWLLLTADEAQALGRQFGLEPLAGGPAAPQDARLVKYVPTAQERQ